MKAYRSPSACAISGRSEEHTSELQSLTKFVCRLLLEKKKTVRSRQANRWRSPSAVSASFQDASYCLVGIVLTCVLELRSRRSMTRTCYLTPRTTEDVA